MRGGGHRIFRPEVEAESEFAEYLPLVDVGFEGTLEGGFTRHSVALDGEIAHVWQPAVGVLQEKVHLTAFYVDLEQVYVIKASAGHQCGHVPAVHKNRGIITGKGLADAGNSLISPAD